MVFGANGSSHLGVFERSLASLVARGQSLAEIERLLRLSPGYLSKLRAGRAVPSFQLVALVALLDEEPRVRSRIASLAGVGRGRRAARSASLAARVATRSRAVTRPALDAFLQVVPDLTPRIPWALVGATALEALGLERSTSDVDIFVADDRREVISVFRDAGFRLAHYSDQHVGAFPRRHTGAGDRVDIHFPRLNWLQRPIRDALETELHGVGVRVIEPVALAAMKLMGPRDLDVEDAAMLIGAGIVQVGDVIALLRRLEREGDPAAARDPWVRMLFQPGLALRRLRGRA